MREWEWEKGGNLESRFVTVLELYCYLFCFREKREGRLYPKIRDEKKKLFFGERGVGKRFPLGFCDVLSNSQLKNHLFALKRHILIRLFFSFGCFPGRM